jgi:NAD-reducing hydrogenase large subunit
LAHAIDITNDGTKGATARKTILIDPVTRIEGHSKITLHLDEQGRVDEARFHVTQFRGFEKFSEGRPFYEMPSLMARICGICPVSHLIASAKACDQLLAVRIPPTAEKLRRIFGLAQVLQSHALSFFHLSSPDLVLGMDADPAQSNLFGVAEKNPEIARHGIRLRQFGQQIIERLGGKRIHPAWIVPGGVSEPLSQANRDAILAGIPEALKIVEQTLDWYKSIRERFREEISTFGNFPTLFMAIVKPDGGLTFYDGGVTIADASGDVVAAGLPAEHYPEYIGEKVESWSYLKSTYSKPKGYPDGIYRVGPLARLNVARRCGTPRADQELAEFHELQRTAVLSSFHYHYARLIEAMYCVERLEQLLTDPEILSKHVRSFARPNCLEGVGACEAPRGTLFHHYKINEQGLIQWVNLVIATGHNNLAMNRSILQVAKHFVVAEHLTHGMLNRVEAVIRAYDPCLSCSTHAAGKMALHVQLLGPQGELLDEVRRS